MMVHLRPTCAPAVGLMAAAVLPVAGGPIEVPNGSFERPVTPYVSVVVDSWQKSPKPDWYVEEGGFLWSQLVGAFKNTPPAASDHIENMDGDQALWMFAVPEVTVFQDLSAREGGESEGTFRVGHAYRLSVGVVPSSSVQPFEGATLEASLYYRDTSTQAVTVAATTITYSAELFADLARFIEFEVNVPGVEPEDEWAGRPIGIRFMSTVSLDLEGGIWDLDNVRLTEIAPPLLSDAGLAGGQFEFQLDSEPGLVVEILTAGDISLPQPAWEVVDSITNSAGTARIKYPVSGARSFFGARYAP